MKKLTAQNVYDTFTKCLFKDDEPTEKHIVAEGIMQKVGFHPERLKEAEPDIISMLESVHPNFKQSGGGGWTFLNFPIDKDGQQWADLHQTCDELIMLGIAIGKVEFQLPRALWPSLPGGVPYVIVKL